MDDNEIERLKAENAELKRTLNEKQKEFEALERICTRQLDELQRARCYGTTADMAESLAHRAASMGALRSMCEQSLAQCITTSEQVDQLANACQEALHRNYEHHIRVLQFADSCQRTIANTISHMEQQAHRRKRGRSSVAEDPF